LLSVAFVGFSQNLQAQILEWVLLGCGEMSGSCPSTTDCVNHELCYGLKYTPGVSGVLTSYTTGFFANCNSGGDVMVSNTSCVMVDNSQHIEACESYGLILFNSSGNSGDAANNTITAGQELILHQVCFYLPYGDSLTITEDMLTDLTLNIDLENGSSMTDFPSFDQTIIIADQICLPPVATNNHSLGNSYGAVVQEVIFENDGFGYDTDSNDNINIASVNLNPASVPGGTGNGLDTDSDGDIDQVSSTQGIWSCDNNGNVSFNPTTGFLQDPTPIEYSIMDFTGLNSNMALVSVDYIPVAQDDESVQNMPTTHIVVEIITNDNLGDQTDPSTVGLNEASVTNGTCTSTDAQGHCLQITVEDEIIWEIDDNFGLLTFTPSIAYTDNPASLDYSVEDYEGNITTASVNIFYLCSTVQLTAFLEGSYQENGLMTTFLNENHLLPGQDKDLSTNLSVLVGATHTPFGQPYGVEPWNYTNTLGTQFGDASAPGAPLNITPYDEDVVDWVLVSVREGDIYPANKIWSCAGWLHNTGNISFPETCPCFVVESDKDYYLMVEHRNHIGVLSHMQVNKLNGTSALQWDFTNHNSFTPDIFRQGQKELESDIWGLYSANGEQMNSIQSVNSADHTTWKEYQNEINYRFSDFNLNVITNSEDETIWKSNQNITSGVIFYE